MLVVFHFFFFFQAEDGIRDRTVTGVQTCALPIFRMYLRRRARHARRRQPWLLAPWVGAKPGRFGGRRRRGAHRRVGARRDRRAFRSEERRVGKECRSGWAPEHGRENEQTLSHMG